MRVHEILNEEDPHHVIVNVERDDKPASGTSKQGYIKVNYDDLVKLFGEPQNHTQDDRADTNFEWDLTIKYRDPLDSDHQADEDEFDQVDVAIYDSRYGEDDRHVNPKTIKQWTVGAHNNTGLWVLMDLLKSKGL